jgi:hypothetical protein
VRVVIANTKKDSSSERTFIRLQADDTTTAAAAADAPASSVQIHPFLGDNIIPNEIFILQRSWVMGP